MEMQKAKEPRPGWLGRLLDQPLLVWIVLGFLASYVLFFLWPIFLNPKQAMFFPRYVPAFGPIGSDLINTLSYSKSLIIEHSIGATPYYPPLTTLLFSALVFLPFREAYLIITLGTLAGYAICTLWFPVVASGSRRISPCLLLLSLTGLLSYGFQFELERGQFNVIAIALALAAIGLFYGHPRLRPVSYVLFTLSVQLKVYPVILIIAFVEDWRNWKKEIVRLLAIVVVNVACLFVLGPQVFRDYVAKIQDQVLHPYVWVGNHSAVSFAMQLFPSHRQAFELGVLALFVLCFLYAIRVAHARRWPGLDPYLLLVCCAAALIIPSESHDYTLPILVPVAAIFFQRLEIAGKGRIRSGLGVILVVLMSFAYSSTLFSYTTKASLPFVGARIPPFLIENNFPALLLVLLTATALVALGHVPSREAALASAADSSGSAG
ncbi:MAG: glycosyltransferase family 87 protein [Anaerolineales bacterium]